MNMVNYMQALLAFGNRQGKSKTTHRNAEDFSIKPVSGGLINHTFKVTYKNDSPFILQQINKEVFSQPRLVQDNYLSIYEYAVSGGNGFSMPAPLYCSPSSTLLEDDNGNYWRAFEFVAAATAFHTAVSVTQASETAGIFGKFTALFEGFDISRLKEVIPGFHDLAWRDKQFETATATGIPERIRNCRPVIDALRERCRYKDHYEVISNSVNYPRRVMHHDAKIANVLFHEETGRVICPVDYDTVMPGYFFSDLGDMIRSMACSLSEDAVNEDFNIRKDYYDVIVNRYCSELENILTDAERKDIHYSGIIMVYMQALRFITDHLAGDSYYQVDYPGQNFERAQNQLRLLVKLEEFLAIHYKFC